RRHEAEREHGGLSDAEAPKHVDGGPRPPEARRRRLLRAAVVEDLDAALGFLEAGVAEARELDAALVERERRLERLVAVLEPLDDRLELGEGGFEVLDARIHSCWAPLGLWAFGLGLWALLGFGLWALGFGPSWALGFRPWALGSPGLWAFGLGLWALLGFGLWALGFGLSWALGFRPWA